MIPTPHRAAFAALLDRLVPADDFPSAIQAGALDDLDARAASDHAHVWSRTLGPGLEALAAEALAWFGAAFEALSPAAQDQLLDELAAGRTLASWPVEPRAFIAIATQLAMEAYYGRIDAPGWRMVGYDPSWKRDPGVAGAVSSPTPTPFASIAPAYDVLVIGSGAGGGVAAWVAAQAGARVLLIERGRGLDYGDMARDHLRNHRLGLYGFNTEPPAEGDPRVIVGEDGRERLVRFSHQRDWHANAMTLGGGTRVYQGMAWRFLPEDFAMATAYGVPGASSLSDWPISYDDLEPFYGEAEWEIGVAGAATHRCAGRRSRAYPLPPPPMNAEAERLLGGARKLGWSTGPVPLLINTAPRGGRGRCVQCGECVGFPCPSDAKNGSFNTVIPRALATGRCKLVTGCRAMRIETDLAGRVTGAELLDAGSGARRSVRAGQVVVACGAIESARLLLLSASGREPHGLGNNADQVGRHLQGHLYAGGFGVFDDQMIAMEGPGVTIATCDFNHGTPGVIGGGALHNEVIKLPLLHWLWALPPELKRWGLQNKRAMRELYRRTGHVWGPVHEIPSPEARVRLDPAVKDAFGAPVARLEGALHPETLRTAEVQRARALEWLEASGASRVWGAPISNQLTAGQHQAGTCRMGTDPTSSVVDPHGRVHGHPNLWVIDASVHVTNGGFNPVLTIYALAFRNARQLGRGEG